MLRLWIVACVACSASQPAAVSNTAPVGPAVTPSCDRIASALAGVPGSADCCGTGGRRRIIGMHCTKHAWPSSVLSCAEPDTHDLLACPYTAGLSDKQQAAFSALFDRLYGDRCPTDCSR